MNSHRHFCPRDFPTTIDSLPINNSIVLSNSIILYLFCLWSGLFLNHIEILQVYRIFIVQFTNGDSLHFLLFTYKFQLRHLLYHCITTDENTVIAKTSSDTTAAPRTTAAKTRTTTKVSNDIPEDIPMGTIPSSQPEPVNIAEASPIDDLPF